MDFIGVFNAVKDSIGPIGAAFVAVMIAVGGFLKAIEAVLQLIAPLTKWTWDDNLATTLGKFVALKIFNKKV